MSERGERICGGIEAGDIDVAVREAGEEFRGVGGLGVGCEDCVAGLVHYWISLGIVGFVELWGWPVR